MAQATSTSTSNKATIRTVHPRATRSPAQENQEFGTRQYFLDAVVRAAVLVVFCIHRRRFQLKEHHVDNF
jgi:hypothetical protein